MTTDPARVIVAGASAGGLGAAYVAFQRPLFGNVLSQSGAFLSGNEGNNDVPYELLTGQYANTERKAVRFYLEVRGNETRRAVGAGPVFIEANQRLRDALLAKGYAVQYGKWPARIMRPGIGADSSGKDYFG